MWEDLFSFLKEKEEPVRHPGSVGLQMNAMSKALVNQKIKDQLRTRPGGVSEGLSGKVPLDNLLNPDYIRKKHSELPATTEREKYLKSQVGADTVYEPNPYDPDPALRSTYSQPLEITGFGPNPLWGAMTGEYKAPPEKPPRSPLPQKKGPGLFSGLGGYLYENLKTSDRGPGESFGKGMAALGDAFASAGQGKGGHLNNILEQQQFWESENRKRYDTEVKNKLQETIHLATMSQKDRDRVAEKKALDARLGSKDKDRVSQDKRAEKTYQLGKGRLDLEKSAEDRKAQLEGLNTRAAKAAMEAISSRNDPRYITMKNEYENNPKAYLNSHSVKTINEERRKIDDLHAKLASAPKNRLDAMKGAYIAVIMGSERHRDFAEVMFPKNFPNGYKKLTAPQLKLRADKIEEKLKYLDKKWTSKGYFDKDYDMLDGARDTYDPFWELIERHNGLKKGSLDPNLIRVNVANNTIEYLVNKQRIPLKMPGTAIFGLRVPDLGVRDALNRVLKSARMQTAQPSDVAHSEMDSALEGIFSDERLRKSGKALTAIELENWRKFSQERGLSTPAGLMNTVLKMREIIIKARARRIDKFMAADPQNRAYYYLRKPKEAPKSEQPARTSTITWQPGTGEPISSRIMSVFTQAGKGKLGTQAVIKDPFIDIWKSNAVNHLRNKKAAKDPYRFNKKEKRFYNQKEYDSLPSPITEDFVHQDNWEDLEIWYYFSKEFTGRK